VYLKYSRGQPKENWIWIHGISYMERKNSVLLVLGMFLAAILVVLLVRMQPDTDEASEIAVPATTTEETASLWQRYSGEGWSIAYPPGFLADPSYAYQALGPGKEIPGISFTVPAAMAEGTNLGRDTRISLETVSTSDCRAGLFVEQASKERSETTRDVSWSVAEFAGAGAGNLYEETVYAAGKHGVCYGIRLFLHSTQIANYDPGTVRAFDREEIMMLYKGMVDSFQFSEV
jgi:hypothetical protein